MAVIWADGFDHYGATESEMLNGAYSQNVGPFSAAIELDSALFRTGTHSIKFPTGTVQYRILRKAFSPGSISAGVGISFALYLHSLPDTGTATFMVMLRDIANAEQICLMIATTGAIQIVRGYTGNTTTQTYQQTGGTTLGTSAPVITAEAWHHIEFYATASQTTGAVNVRVDNNEVIALTNQDTVNTSNVEFSQVAFVQAGTSSGTSLISQIDDIYMYDTTGSDGNAYPLGDLQAMWLTATADTAEADFTKSTGTDGYALIDEVTPNDADYIQAAAATDRSDFALTDLPADINYVETLFAHTRMLKTEAGTAQIQQSFMQGTDQSAGTDRDITTTATYWFDNHPLDPDTAAKWTRTGVNSALLRYDRTA